ncbi:hypothetical protein GCM10022631_09880 [Deinococcus rubellus]|uniref:hypothetical protein n=1 Tax=Deinococcus rubellus TaxID=1889240 RepID=UPI0031E8F9FF
MILKRQSVVEQAEAITQAALDCGRIHTDRAEQLYRLLTTAALAHHFQLRPDAKVTPNRLAFFLVVDELPELLGLGRATVYRAFADLKWGGLVDHRAWRTSSTMAGGKTVAGGVVVEVILTPRQGTQARVRAEYLRQHYRNLDADRFAGRTAWQWKTEFKEHQTLACQLEEQAAQLLPHEYRQAKALRARAEEVRQSISFEQIETKINHILRWTLSLSEIQPVSLTVSQRQDVVYRLGDLLTATPQQRGAMIEERAQLLCEAVGDQNSNRRFWCWLLWRGLALAFARPAGFAALQASLLRLMVDIREWAEDQHTGRPLKRPAALFISRLKKSDWWDELRGAGMATD